MASHSWLKQGLTSLSTIKNQLTEFTTEVLQDVAQERDSNAELTTAKNRILHLEQELASRSKEVEHLRQRLRDENWKATEENQQSVTCWDDSEKGDLEPDDWNWKDSSVDNVNDLCTEFSEHRLVEKPAKEEIPFSYNGSNLDVRKLTDEIKQLQAECAHWKELAKTNEEKAERNTTSAATTELEEAKREIEKLCTELAVLRNERMNVETCPEVERTVDLWENDWGDTEEWMNKNDQLSKQRTISSSTPERCPVEQLAKQSEEESIGSINESDEREKHWRVEISRLQEERDQALEELYAEHQEAMAQVLMAKESLAKICDEYRDQNQVISDELGKLKAEQQSLLEENNSLQMTVDNLKNCLQTESKEKTSLFDINEQLEEHMRILKMQLTDLQGKHERCAEENENAKLMLENLTVEFEQMKQAWTEEQQKHAQQTATNAQCNNTIVEMRATIEQLQCMNSTCFDKLQEIMIDNGSKADIAELTLERLADLVKQNQNSLLQRLHERDEQCSVVIQQLQQVEQEKLEKEVSTTNSAVSLGGLVKFLLSRDESQSRRLHIMDKLIARYRYFIGKETADAIQSLSNNNYPKDNNTLQYSHSFEDIANYKDNYYCCNVEKRKRCFIHLPSCRRCKSTISVGHFDFRNEQNEQIQESQEQLIEQLQYAEAEAKRSYCEVLDKLLRSEEYSNKVVEELQAEIAALGQKMVENETNSAAQLQNVQMELNNCKRTAMELAEENAQLRNELSDNSASTVASTEQLKQLISTLEVEKQELILLINQKHEESVHYHQELQNAMAAFEAWKEQQAQQQALNRNEEESAAVKRLNQQLAEKDATIERLTKNVDEQLNMAIQAKDRATAELAAVRLHSEHLQEQVTFLEEAKRRSFSEVERLKSHLVELEQTYSEEACRAEDRETDLRKRLQELENQLNNTLQEAQQKSSDFEKEIEELRSMQNVMSAELNAANGHINILSSELENSQKSVYSLQNVLEAFQKDRESSLNQQSEASRVEIEYLKAQIDNAQAANQALQEKVEQYEGTIQMVSELQSALCAKENSLSDLQTQLRERDRRLLNMEKELHQLQHVRDGKIDKDVLKNLFLGYLTAPVNKKAEVAHLIGSVLSFSADEFEKMENSVGGGGATGWLQLLRLGGTGSDVKTSTSQSLAAEFVKFLQMESSPKEQLDDQLITAAGDNRKQSTTNVSHAVKDDSGGNRDNSSGTTPFFLLSGSARSQPTSSIPITLDLPTLPTAYEGENIPPTTTTTSAQPTTWPEHEQVKPTGGGGVSSSSTSFLRRLLDSDEQ